MRLRLLADAILYHQLPDRFQMRLAVPELIALLFMLVITFASYLVTRKYYGWSMIGFTVTTVYSLQLNGAQFLLPRIMDTLMGCLITFAGMIWLWP